MEREITLSPRRSIREITSPTSPRLTPSGLTSTTVRSCLRCRVAMETIITECVKKIQLWKARPSENTENYQFVILSEAKNLTDKAFSDLRDPSFTLRMTVFGRSVFSDV